MQFQKNLSVGADLAYHFGDFTNDFTENVIAPDFTQYTTRERNITQLNGFTYNLGLLYNRK